jgi:hypothetical protein
VNATAWSRGLEVTGGGTGVVSHAGLVLLCQLADRTGLTARLSPPARDQLRSITVSGRRRRERGRRIGYRLVEKGSSYVQAMWRMSQS